MFHVLVVHSFDVIHWDIDIHYMACPSVAIVDPAVTKTAQAPALTGPEF